MLYNGICIQRFICLIMFKSPHPELLFNGAGVGLRVQAVHVVVHGAELTGRNGGVATETCLQNGIVDEDILLLQETASSLRIYQTSNTHDNRQHIFTLFIYFYQQQQQQKRMSQCSSAFLLEEFNDLSPTSP